MTRRNRHLHVSIANAALLLAFACAFSARGQSLSSLKIGDPSSKLSALGKPTTTDQAKGTTIRRWVLPNGNDLSVATDEAGQVVYLEADWNPGADTNPACGLPGLSFGSTTLAQLRKRFGSNGFAFTDQSGQLLTDDGAVMLNSYEANGTVVTFYNKVSNAAAAKLNPEGKGTIADNAKLDAISLASAAYAKSNWGDRVYDPQYKNIAWK